MCAKSIAESDLPNHSRGELEVGRLEHALKLGTISRLVLVTPSGGLNDVLCQLVDAIDFAIATKSVLIVNNQHRSGPSRFLGECFSFDSMPTVFTDIDRRDRMELERFLKNRNQRVLQVDYNHEGFARGYPGVIGIGPKVIHFSGRKGGEHGYSFFNYVDVKQPILDRSREEATLIDAETIGLHIRHTDYRTDFVSVIDYVKRKFPDNKVFLASDGREVIDYGIKVFGRSLINPPRLRPNGEFPLHKQPETLSLETHRQLTIETLLDLFLLASCGHFLYTVSANNGPGKDVLISGFSKLVVGVRQNADKSGLTNANTSRAKFVVTWHQVIHLVGHVTSRMLGRAFHLVRNLPRQKD